MTVDYSSVHVCYLTKNISLIVPPCRMVVVQGFIDDDESGGEPEEKYEIYKVGALTAKVQQRYVAVNAVRPCESPDHESLVENGWYYDGELEVYSMIIFDPVEGSFFDMSFVVNMYDAEEVVFCTWPQEEDAQRLAETIAEVKFRSRRRYDYKKKNAAGDGLGPASLKPPGDS